MALGLLPLALFEMAPGCWFEPGGDAEALFWASVGRIFAVPGNSLSLMTLRIAMRCSSCWLADLRTSFEYCQCCLKGVANLRQGEAVLEGVATASTGAIPGAES